MILVANKVALLVKKFLWSHFLFVFSSWYYWKKCISFLDTTCITTQVWNTQHLESVSDFNTLINFKMFSAAQETMKTENIHTHTQKKKKKKHNKYYIDQSRDLTLPMITLLQAYLPIMMINMLCLKTQNFVV